MADLPLPIRKFLVCYGPEMEDVEVSADSFHYVQDTGWLSFSIMRKPVAVFAPGKWTYFMEDK